MFVLRKVIVDIFVFGILSICELSLTVETNSIDVLENGIITSSNVNIGGETFQNSTQNVTPVKGKRKKNVNRIKPLRKRKFRKRRRKQKNRLVEITTENVIIISTKAEYNYTLNKLTEKLDKNPEDNFDEFKIDKNTLNKQFLTKNPLGNSTGLVTNNVTKNFGKTFNRCRKNRGGCAHLCNREGSIKCSCLKGFYLGPNQRSCIDVDECKINNSGCESECVNLVGSFHCKCPAGLTLADDRKSCQDVNECFLRNGHGPCQDTCENTLGSYKCSCIRLKGTTISSDGHACEDLNECLENNGGCSHECINTVGRSFCSCPDGMELSSDWKTCQDVNECEKEEILSSCKNCLNTRGSFICLDNMSEMQNDQPVNNVCKTLLLPSLGFLSCTKEGAFQSYTKKGRKRIVNGPGTACQLVCPAGYRLLGEFNMICGLDGDWEGDRSGKCVDAFPPILKCPPSQRLIVDNNSCDVHVKFSSPITDVNWKYVTGFPSWAKNLEGNLSVGKHVIVFTVKDPTTQLFSSCYFKIIVETNKN